MKEYSFMVEENDQIRIDVFITNLMGEYTRNMIQKLIETGNVKVNDNIIKANYKVKQNDRIYIMIPAVENTDIIPEKMDLNIVYEDEEIIVVDKPQGMVVHPAPGHETGTLVNGLLYHCGDNLSHMENNLRPGIVHRIDKDTSGIIVVAKTNRAHLGLAEQLADRSMKRIYKAIVYHNIKNDEGTICAPIGRSPRDRKKMAVVQNGKEAVTHFKVVERYGKYTLIEARLETGRTHQIRVHMSSMGNPLLGDLLYGPSKQLFQLEGQVLHAETLGFLHPTTREPLDFVSPLPVYFTNVLNIIAHK